MTASAGKPTRRRDEPGVDQPERDDAAERRYTTVAASSTLAGPVPASAAPATTRLTVSPALKSVLLPLLVAVLAAVFAVVLWPRSRW